VISLAPVPAILADGADAYRDLGFGRSRGTMPIQLAGNVKLVYMANQIGKFFAHRREDEAVAAITDHLVKFWDPRMRKAILARLDKDGSGFDPLVRKAIETLQP
jgi:formate dehydrogenase subunit delta